MTERCELTQLLRAWTGGDVQARDALVAATYQEIRRMAHQRVRSERDRAAYQSASLAHEAFERLIEQKRVAWENRAQFFAIASCVMRRLLVDRDRARRAQKRGRGEAVRPLQTSELALPRELDIELLSEALDRLSEQDERQAKVVELRFFGGLTVDETAASLGVSPATVKREWSLARAWLKREMSDGA